MMTKTDTIIRATLNVLKYNAEIIVSIKSLCVYTRSYFFLDTQMYTHKPHDRHVSWLVRQNEDIFYINTLKAKSSH